MQSGHSIALKRKEQGGDRSFSAAVITFEPMEPALEAIHVYYRVFSTLDLTAIVSCFCEPCMVIGPQGMFSAANRAALAEALAATIERLKARGYKRSEFVEPEVTMLGETAALVRGVAVRYASAGTELERLPISYLTYRSEMDWKIAVMVFAGYVKWCSATREPMLFASARNASAAADSFLYTRQNHYLPY